MGTAHIGLVEWLTLIEACKNIKILLQFIFVLPVVVVKRLGRCLRYEADKLNSEIIARNWYEK